MTDPAEILLPSDTRGIPLSLVRATDWTNKLATLPAETRTWSIANGFNAEAGRALLVPGKKGAVGAVLAGVSDA